MGNKDDGAIDLGGAMPIDDNATKSDVTAVHIRPASESTESGGKAFSKKFDPTRRNKSSDYPNEDCYTAVNGSIAEGENPTDLLNKVMRHVVNRHRDRKDGTVVSAAAIVDEKLYTCNLGDAPVIVFIYDPKAKDENKKVEVRQVTRDHILDDDKERDLMKKHLVKKSKNPARIIFRSGHWCITHENGHEGLVMSRGVGDSGNDLMDTPENQSLNFKPYLDEGKRVYVVAGSDGIMENTTLEDMKKMMEKLIQNAISSTGEMPGLDDLAIHLTQWRHKDGNLEYSPRSDDATVVVQEIKREPVLSHEPGKKPVKLITIADGHRYNPDYKDNFLANIIAKEIPDFFQNPHKMRASKMDIRPDGR